MKIGHRPSGLGSYGKSRPQPPSPPPSRSEVFLRESAACSRTLAGLGGFTNAASFGYLGGALTAGTLATGGGTALGLALAGAGCAGLVGFYTMGRVSDGAAWVAGRFASPEDPSAAALGRASLNVAVDLLGGSPLNAALSLGLSTGWGAYKAWRSQ